MLERERNWDADQESINKWTVLFNLQKDYLKRIKPNLDTFKNYNDILLEKRKKEQQSKENLRNIIQFQNKINKDLSHNEKFYVENYNKADDGEIFKNILTQPYTNDQGIFSSNKRVSKDLKSNSQDKNSAFIETPESVYYQLKDRKNLEKFYPNIRGSYFNNSVNIEHHRKDSEKRAEKFNLQKQKSSIPWMTSFLELKDDINFDKGFFEKLIKHSDNFNLETQRRGRRRSRFPDPQWDCAESQISKILRYLCEEEVSFNYQKYCKPLFQQINTIIESYLYHDTNIEICQNLHMCPVSVDF